MQTIYAKRGEMINLGREGENLARQIVFDVYEWQEMYGDGEVQLVAQRMGDEYPYPCAIKMDGNHAVWVITRADTAVPGRYGKCELSYYVGESIVKSETYVTCVLDALGEPTENPPEAYKSWLDQVLEAGSTVETAAADAKNSAKSAQLSSEFAAAYAQDATAQAQEASRYAELTYEATMKAPDIRDGYWWVWNAAEGEYVPTDVRAASENPDWNQSDETALDYIKNRPFYESSSEVVLLPETVADCTGEATMDEIKVDFTLSAGATYIVALDGERHEVVAREVEGEVLLSVGDVLVLQEPGWPWLRVESYVPAIIKLSISWFGGRFIKTIDPQYLPTETWTFTLDDGTVIEKKVVVAE